MKVRLTIDDMQRLAEKRGIEKTTKPGKCLSKKYINARTPLKWKCGKCGFEWEAIPDNVKRGSWCRMCGYKSAANKQKLSLKQMQEYARSKGGKCLSRKYIHSKNKLIWQCGICGYIWMAIPNNIKRGHWCPKCANKVRADKERGCIEEMQEIAMKREGKCLSKKYINARSPLKWQCGKCGHIWRAIPDSIKRGSWCAICSRKIRADKERGCIEEMQEIAIKRGGKCRSIKYINARTTLKWKCGKCGHIWRATPDNIKRGKWCPICSQGIGEKICRKYFEAIFKTKFPKKRPNWLMNSQGNCMELDGYNKKLNLAFEYQGIQHYKYNPHFHKDKKEFEKRKMEDKQKIEICKKKYILLIQVPYYIEYDKMQDFIINEYQQKSSIILPKLPKYDYRNFKYPQKVV